MRQTRKSRNVTFQVEAMDDRAVPSAINFGQLVHNMATQRAAASRASSFRPANTFGSSIAAARASRVGSVTPTHPANSSGLRGTGPILAPTSPTNVTRSAATNNDIGDVKNGPLAKAGQELIKLYQDFQQFGGGGTFRSTHAPTIQVVGNSVKLDVRGPGNVNSLVSALANLGFQVQSIDANTHTVEGLLPISQLPNAAQLSEVSSIGPVHYPGLASH